MTSLFEYEGLSRETDVTDESDDESRSVYLLGALGEVGSVVEEVKKYRRDGSSYTGYRDRVAEELGDLLWYVVAIARAEQITLFDDGFVAAQTPRAGFSWFELGRVVSELVASVHAHDDSGRVRDRLREAARLLADAARHVGISLESVAEKNLRKTRSRWQSNEGSPAPYVDSKRNSEERLPRSEVVEFVERSQGGGGAYVVLRCRGVTVGDRLTDNAYEDDGYRFHDAFHLAHAAVLGWSPVTRALFRCKRKTNSKVDEVEDGARAIIAEESISFLVFDYARKHNELNGVRRVDQDLIRQIKSLVAGLEVADRETWEWQRAILQGYAVFRSLKNHPRGGRVRIDAAKRSITYDGPIVDNTS